MMCSAPMNILRNFVRNKLFLGNSVKNRRYILSSAYQCTEKWNHRLKDPVFGANNAHDIGIKIVKALDNGELVAPIDYDIYINLLHQLDITSLDFAERLMLRYNATNSAYPRCDSTMHGIVREYLAMGEESRMVNLLKNRLTTGVFLDTVSANLLLDNFIKQQDWSLAVSVVHEMVLQDLFYTSAQSEQGQTQSSCPNPLTTALSLHACHNYFVGDQWRATQPADQEVETSGPGDSSVEYKFVKYVRNPNYDDHFDVTDDRLRLGKSLAAIAHALHPSVFNGATADSQRLATLAANWRLVGLALYEKFDKLIGELGSGRMPGILANATVNHVLSLLETATHLPPGQQTKRPGEVPRYSQAEIGTFRDTIKKMIDQLASSNRVADIDLSELTFSFVQTQVEQQEPSETAKVVQLYDSFETSRRDCIESQLTAVERNSALSTVKEKLVTLLEQEEKLTYFDHLQDVRYAAWLAPRTRREKRRRRKDEWQADLENLERGTQRRNMNLEKLE